MSERRWKVVVPVMDLEAGDILTLNEDDGGCIPWFNSKRKGFRRYAVSTSLLIEIDADGKTIRTYKEGDTLDGGTLVKTEEEVGLELNLNAILGRSKVVGGNYYADANALVYEVQRLRDKLAAVHDVWEGSVRWAERAVIRFESPKRPHWIQYKEYTRVLPKTIDDELLDEFLPLEGDDKVMSPSTARHKARAMLAEYKARTEGKQ